MAFNRDKSLTPPKPNVSFLTDLKRPTMVLDDKKTITPFDYDKPNFSAIFDMYEKDGKEAVLRKCAEESILYSVVDDFVQEGNECRATLLGGACGFSCGQFPSKAKIAFLDFLLNDTDILLKAYNPKTLHWLIEGVLSFFVWDFRQIIFHSIPSPMYEENWYSSKPDISKEDAIIRLKEGYHVLSQLAKKGACSAALLYEEKLLDTLHKECEEKKWAGSYFMDPYTYDETISGLIIFLIDDIIHPIHENMLETEIKDLAMNVVRFFIFNAGLNPEYLFQLGDRTSVWVDNPWTSFRYRLLHKQRHTQRFINIEEEETNPEYKIAQEIKREKEKGTKARIAIFHDFKEEVKDKKVAQLEARKLIEVAATSTTSLFYFPRPLLLLAGRYLDPDLVEEKKNSPVLPQTPVDLQTVPNKLSLTIIPSPS